MKGNQHPKIAPFIEYLESLSSRPPLEEVVQQLKAFDISMEELGENVQFHSNHYGRNLMFENEHVQLLCLCWKSGQRSPVHDHADSTCAVKIITGVASETIYEMTPSGFIKPIATVDFHEDVIGSKDSDIHQVSNLQAPGLDLVTLHYYAPPLKRMKTYSTDSKFSQVYEPVNEAHIDGSGI